MSAIVVWLGLGVSATAAFYSNFVVAGAAIVGVVLFSYFLQSADDKKGSGQKVTGVLNQAAQKGTFENRSVNKAVDDYTSLYGQDSRVGGKEHGTLLSKRLNLYTQMVNDFYDLVTDFYEYGWGESFHFAPSLPYETFQESMRRHEWFLAARLGLNSKTHCADFGCGVGGPMRAIATFSGSKITGINNNDYQIKVGTKHNERDSLTHLCGFMKADFMKLPVPDNTFDHAYEIEATCHAPDKVACYREICRSVKPGGLFAGYEWVMTGKFDPNNKRHVAIKNGIEIGNGLPDIATIPHVLESLNKAGFDVIESCDLAKGPPNNTNQIPWYMPLKGSWSVRGFRMTAMGRQFTHVLVTVLETMKIAPKGSVKVSKLLNDTANDLVDGGEREIFTPAFFFLARKRV
jgi:sterol 24-C-methyltransferase